MSALDRSSFGYAVSINNNNALFPPLVKNTSPWNHHTQNAVGTNKVGIIPMANETQEDIWAWTPSPTKRGLSFTFQDGPVSMNLVGAAAGVDGVATQGETTQ